MNPLPWVSLLHVACLIPVSQAAGEHGIQQTVLSPTPVCPLAETLIPTCNESNAGSPTHRAVCVVGDRGPTLRAVPIQEDWL